MSGRWLHGVGLAVASTLLCSLSVAALQTRPQEPPHPVERPNAVTPAAPVAAEASEAAEITAARIALRGGQWRQTLARAESELAKSPHSIQWSDLKSEALLRGGQISRALQWANQQDADASVGPRSWTVLARIASARGDAPQAGTQMERALSAAPNDPEILYWGAELSAERERTLSLMARYLEHSAGEPAFRVQAVRSALKGIQARKTAGRAVWQAITQPAALRGKLRRLKNDAGLAGWLIDLRLGTRQRKVPVLFDTGSSGLFLSRRVAKRVGADFEVDRQLSGSESRRVTQGVLKRFALGELVFEDATVKSVDVELDPRGRFHGVLGLLPLRGYRVTLDPAAGVWHAKLSDDELRTEAPDAEGFAQPYWWFSGMILVELEWSPGRVGLFLLDTGAQRSVLATSILDRAPVGELWIRGLGGARRAARTDAIQKLRWGPAVIAPQEGFLVLDLAAESQASGVELAGVVGLDLLSQGVLILEPAGQFVRQVPYSSN